MLVLAIVQFLHVEEKYILIIFINLRKYCLTEWQFIQYS
jgi:hypothetical protein